VKQLRFLIPVIFGILGIQVAFALPVGDPRVPDENSRLRMDMPVNQGMHEISVHAFMGASRINYPDMDGTRFSPGFGAAITYSYFFLPQWSFLVGGGLQLFNNRGTAVDGDFTGSLETDDMAVGGRDPITLQYEFTGYEETQWSLMLMIPLMFQYQSNETNNKAFYYALGTKIGLPFAGTYEGKVKTARICGFYNDLWGPPEGPPNLNECLENGGNENPALGFGNFGKMTSSSKLEFSTAFFAAAEAGIKWRLYSKLAVYTGFWLDWALNDIAIRSINKQSFTWTRNEGNLEDVNTPKADVKFMSRTTGKAVPMSAGFTFRFAFGAGDRYAVPDSVRWIKEIAYRDSLLSICNARNKALEDSLERAQQLADMALDSLIECRQVCMSNMQSKEEMKRLADSLFEAKRLAELALALERARLEVERLERERAARLADFRNRLKMIANGLDDYKVTQTAPSEKAKEKLDLAAELMHDYPDLKLRITGHTCDRGTHDANIGFGTQRAESAKNYLVSKGINPNRVETASKAELEPIAPNVSEENRRKNRRVQIDILEGGEGIKLEAK
jgi:outer membrane protein OmpA-like peptidoglycan-associated protein